MLVVEPLYYRPHFEELLATLKGMLEAERNKFEVERKAFVTYLIEASHVLPAFSWAITTDY